MVIDVGKKYNERNLRYMRQFYELFSSIKWNPLGSKLSWSHFRELLVLKDDDAIKYYMEICELKNLTRRELHEKIRSKEFGRLPLDIKNKINNTTALNVIDVIPDPILIKDNRNYDKFSEYALKELILNNLDVFLSQLGHEFSCVGNEYRIKFSDRYNYIDLLLFNIAF